MGTSGLVEKPGDEDLVVVEEIPTDRADPLAFAVQTVGASVNVHKPVGLAHGGEGRRFYLFAVDKANGANRAGPGHTGFAFQIVVFVLPLTAKNAPPAATTEKEAVAKVQEARADDDEA
jgi:hypothetical protein